MPSKIPRKRDTLSSSSIIPHPIDKETALILGAAHAFQGVIQAAGETASATVNAAGSVLQASISSFGECFTSFMGYLKECEVTERVIAQETAATYRMEIWSRTVIAEAEEQTERLRISASLVLATIRDRASQRESKLGVIKGFMDAYQGWNAMLTQALANRADRMPLDDRELLQQHIEILLDRARDMEAAITRIAVTL